MLRFAEKKKVRVILRRLDALYRRSEFTPSPPERPYYVVRDKLSTCPSAAV